MLDADLLEIVAVARSTTNQPTSRKNRFAAE